MSLLQSIITTLQAWPIPTYTALITAALAFLTFVFNFWRASLTDVKLDIQVKCTNLTVDYGLYKVSEGMSKLEHIKISVVNKGGKTTLITGIEIYAYKNWLMYFLRRHLVSIVLTTDNNKFPYKLEPGHVFFAAYTLVDFLPLWSTVSKKLCYIHIRHSLEGGKGNPSLGRMDSADLNRWKAMMTLSGRRLDSFDT